MPAEAIISVTVKSAKGDLHTLRGDSWAQFVAEANAMLGADAEKFVQGVRQTFGAQVSAAPAPQTVAQAENVVTGAFPGAQPVTSTVGQPLPQPGETSPAADVPAVPGGAPINPETGQPYKKYVPPGVSKKTNKPYKGFWTDN